MDPQLETFLFSIAGLIVIIGIGYIGYLMLLSTPAGKGLNAFMGGVGAVLGAVGDQLTTCSKNGIFGKGCYLGWGGVAAGVAYIGASIFAYFKVGINNSISNYSALKGQSANKTIGDLQAQMPDVNSAGPVEKWMDARNYSQAAKDAAVEKMYAKTFRNMEIEQYKSQGLSPQELAAKTAEAQTAFEAKVAKANEGLNEEDQTDSDDATNEFVPEE